jgi:type VI secretion system protein ImpJ
MSYKKKIAWSQGMFLQPQHFQQAERASEHFAALQVGALTRLNWGLSLYETDTTVLKQGQFRLLACRGVFPDGTPFDAPDTDALPSAIALTSEHLGQTIWLALSLRVPGEPEYLLEGETTSARRGRTQLTEVRDCSDRELESVETHLVGLNLQLIVSPVPPPGFTSIPLQRLEMIGQGGDLRLARDFVETTAISSGSMHLKSLIGDLAVRLTQRSRNSSGRTARGGSTEALYEFLFLLAVNRQVPVFKQLANEADVHPYVLYLRLVELAGELASFGEVTKAAPEFAAYDHADQYRSFAPVVELIRAALGQVLPQTATRIPLVKHGDFEIFQGLFPDARLVSPKNGFVLQVLSDGSPELIRKHFGDVAKISTPDAIKSLISAMVAGFPLHALLTVPNEVRNPNPRAVYFEVKPTASDYAKLVNGISVHMARTIPGLQMELWVLHADLRAGGT